MLINTLFENYHKHILLFYQHSILIARENRINGSHYFFRSQLKVLYFWSCAAFFLGFFFPTIGSLFLLFWPAFFLLIAIVFFYFLFFLQIACQTRLPRNTQSPQTERFAPFFRSEQLEQASHAILMTRHLKFNRANCIASI